MQGIPKTVEEADAVGEAEEKVVVPAAMVVEKAKAVEVGEEF